MLKDHYPVLVLGLDGATFDLMLPWVEAGHLPCLGNLIRQGVSGPLESTLPPITPCAWSSFMTGKNPGKHGLFDFVEPSPDGAGFRYTNALSRHGETLWGYLSRLGLKVGVVNVPMTYPPEPVNGYLISGLDTPDARSRFTHPDTLKEELHDAGINYRIDPQFLGNMRTDGRRAHWLRELCAIETDRTKALQYLRHKFPADFTMAVYTATDQVQHHFWHYMDPAHPKHDPKGAEHFRDAIRDVYVHIDRQLAAVLKETGEDTVVIIMSDHGFGPTTDVRLRLNQALEGAGLLAFAREGKSGKAVRRWAGLLDRLLRSMLPPGAKRRIASLFPRLRVWFEKLDEAKIDWDRTVAFTNEVSRSCPTVWLNRVLENGPGSPDEARLLQDLAATEKVLLDLRDPQTGRPAISRVFRAREVYHGPFADKAPDLLPSWWEDGFLLEQSEPGGPASRLVERSTAPIRGGVEFAGTHRLDGVFIMAGGPVRRGQSIAGARIIDVAPTVLYLMAMPIPEDMDGQPLLGTLEPDFVARRAPQTQLPPAPVPESPAAEAVYTDAEEELIARRLQAMGYIE